MSRHVALLRGINVGKAKRIAMADLKTLMERLGYREVRTLLNSGNVVFTAPAATLVRRFHFRRTGCGGWIRHCGCQVRSDHKIGKALGLA